MLKASLQSSLGRLNIRIAPLHAPAAYVSSLVQSTTLIARILGMFLTHFNILLVRSVLWLRLQRNLTGGALEDIDIPLQQHPLSHSIDEALFHHLLDSALDSPARALALSSAIPPRVIGGCCPLLSTWTPFP